MKKTGKKVVVAMSGGVDSSVTAAILKKEGYDVIGVFFKLWEEYPQNSFKKNVREVRNVCQTLNIPFKIINLEKKFKKEIVNYFLKEYKNGQTPNPCVACNKKIKFETLFEEMKKNKADFVATGHYVRIVNCKPDSRKIKCKLLKAKDKNKDQSYFLYNLTQNQLKHILFPLGEYKKEETKKIAHKLKLPASDKVESQDICFYSGKIENFLKRNLNLKEGKIVDENGKDIGMHKGLPLYTIGQRKGINVDGNGPYYSIKKDCKKNVLKIAQGNKNPLLYTKKMKVGQVNWISKEPKFPEKVLIKIRYRSSEVCGIIKKRSGGYMVKFNQSQRAVTTGQSVVFYAKNGEVLGGGVIIENS